MNTRTLAEWGRLLNVSQEIVYEAQNGREVMFLRTDDVSPLQGNPLQDGKLRELRAAMIDQGQPLKTLPVLKISAESNFAYLDEGNHRLKLFKDLGMIWFPVRVRLFWNEVPEQKDAWKRRRYARGRLQIETADESKLPLRNIGHDSYTPNTATPLLLRRVYGLEVLNWTDPPTVFRNTPE